MGKSEPSEQPDPIASIFVEFLGRRVAGEDADIEELCGAHPEYAEELRRLYSVWMEAGGSVGQGGGFAPTMQSIRARFGEEVDPGISLGSEDEPDSSGSSGTVLDRLKEHRSGTPRYRLKGEIARGGMGAILRVWDEDLRRHLAMKVILGQGVTPASGDTPAVPPEILSRFLEEAQVTGQLDHPGIVPIHELGLDSDGRVYFTMKLVKGRDFGHVIEDVHGADREWNVVRAVGLLLKACEALAFAHSKGVVHRDLKPGNLMVGRFGEVYVMDWGLARVVGRKETRDLRISQETREALSTIETDRREQVDSPLLTMDGQVLGTPSYMSPEQARGDLPNVGAASDVYSMGAILYHLLAHRMPYVPPDSHPSPMLILNWVLEGSPRPLRELGGDMPPELVSICEKAMSRDPGDRYENMERLADDLRRYLEGRPVTASPPRLGTVLRLAIRRHQAVAMTVAAAAVVLIVVTGLFMGGIWSARNRAEQEAFRATASDAESRRRLAELYAEQGRHKYLAGRPRQALMYLSRALEKGLDTDAIRYLIGRASRQLPTKIISFDCDPQFLPVISPDGRAIAAGGSPSGIEIRSAETGSLIRKLDGSYDLWTISADGKMLATLGQDGLLQVHRVLEDDPPVTVAADQHGSKRIALSPDGSMVASADGTGTRVWDLASRVRLCALKWNGFGRNTPFFDLTERHLLAQTDVDTVEVCDVRTGKPLRVLKSEDVKLLGSEAGDFTFAHMSPDGASVLTGIWNGGAVVWDLSSGKPQMTRPAGKSWLRGGEFSPAGGQVILCHRNEGGVVLDPESGAEINSFDHPGATLARLGPRGNLALTAGDDRVVRVWDIRSGELICISDEHSSEVQDATFSSDGLRVISVDFNCRVKICVLPWLPRQRSLVDKEVLSDSAGAAFFSGDGLLLAIVHSGLVRLFSTSSLTELSSWRMAEDFLDDLAFSPDGSRVLTISAGGVRGEGDHATAELWECKTGRKIAQLPPLKGGSRCSVEWSPRGDRFITVIGGEASNAEWAGIIRDSETMRESGRFAPSTTLYTNPCFSPDGSAIAYVDDRVLRIADGVTGRTTLFLGGTTPGYVINGVAFSPDGRNLVSFGSDSLATMWDLQSGSPLFTKSGVARIHSWAVKFNADGRFIVGVMEGHLVCVWDARSGELAYSVPAATASSFSVDGNWLQGAGEIREGATGVLIEELGSRARGVRKIYHHPSGSHCILLFSSGHCQVWDLSLDSRPSNEIHASVLRHLQLAWDGERLQVHRPDAGPARGMRFSPVQALNYSSWRVAEDWLNPSIPRLEEALLMIQDALRRDPGNADYLNTQGAVQFRLGRHEDALRSLHASKSTRKADHRPPALEDEALLCMTLKALGRDEEAQQALNAATEIRALVPTTVDTREMDTWLREARVRLQGMPVNMDTMGEDIEVVTRPDSDEED